MVKDKLPNYKTDVIHILHKTGFSNAKRDSIGNKMLMEIPWVYDLGLMTWHSEGGNANEWLRQSVSELGKGGW